LTELKNNGVTIVDTMQSVDYGKFVHILDPENNKIELWEANDAVYEKMGRDMGLETTK
jgi:predicted enzyme related to lactoylglutathione lyase